MSKFFREDDYGDRRHGEDVWRAAASANAVTSTYVPPAPPKPPTEMEKKLSEMGFKGAEIAETATMVMKAMERVKDQPLAVQKKQVEMCLGSRGGGMGAITITAMALSEMDNKKGPAAAAPAKPTVTATKMKM